MTQATRSYKHSAAGTDWAALMLGAGMAVGCHGNNGHGGWEGFGKVVWSA